MRRSGRRKGSSRPSKPSKAKAAPKKATSKPSSRPQAKSEAQVRREVRLRARRADGIAAADIADLVPGKPEVRTDFLNGMIADGILEKRGKSKATRYFLANKPDKEPVKKPPPTPTTPAKSLPKTDQELNAAILEILADRQEHKAADFYGLWPTLDEAREDFRRIIAFLVFIQNIVKTGKGSGTRYKLAEELDPTSTAAASEPTPVPTTTIDDETVWNRIWELQGKREEGSVTADQLYDLWPDLKTAKRSYKRRLNSLVADGWVVKIGEGRTMSYRALENQTNE